MNAPHMLSTRQLDLARLVLSGFTLPETHAIEAQWLDALRAERVVSVSDAWLQWLHAPPARDYALCALASRCALSRAEIVAIALCCAAELDPMASRILHCLQGPVASVLPTMGLVAQAALMLDESDGSDLVAHLTSLHSGEARRVGLIEFVDDQGVLVERALRTPQPIVLALAGFDASWPEIERPCPEPVDLGKQIESDLDRLAHTLASGGPLVIRAAWPQDGFAAAARLAASLGRPLAHLPPVLPPGAGIWLSLSRRIPVFSLELAPGELRQFAPIAGYDGPVVMVAGTEGAVSWNHEHVTQWRLPTPSAEERIDIWRANGAPDELASRLGRQLRLSAGRIRALAVAAGRMAVHAGRSSLDMSDIARASRGSATLDLGSLAQAMPDEVGDAALVLPPPLRANLEQLHIRCLRRDTLATGLGVALRTRYRPGVRALFTGVSGTGKTLAAGWLATRLGLPLYRVDLSAVVSKYIGETEKNLAQLFARAESAELVLLFDEADALFGKRTDVKDSTDRFANQQTNYLLQRIENFDGIAILTSNSRSRFDPAFTRRLDMVIEFPAPTPEERRALWQAHLGDGHALEAAEINRLAVTCDLAGGHIRACTLMAASLASPIRYAELRTAIVAEYAKLGRMPPAGL